MLVVPVMVAVFSLALNGKCFLLKKKENTGERI